MEPRRSWVLPRAQALLIAASCAARMPGAGPSEPVTITGSSLFWLALSHVLFFSSFHSRTKKYFQYFCCQTHCKLVTPKAVPFTLGLFLAGGRLRVHASISSPWFQEAHPFLCPDLWAEARAKQREQFLQPDGFGGSSSSCLLKFLFVEEDRGCQK